MKQARREHSSCFLKNKLYVFGGYQSRELDSIEWLDTGGIISNTSWAYCSWQKLSLPIFTPRYWALVCAVSDTQIAIMGGYPDKGDVIMYDDETKTA